MRIEQLVTAYSELPMDRQIAFLAQFASVITVSGWGTYDPESLEVREPTKLRAFNEVQHEILNLLRELLASGQARYSAADFWSGVFHRADLGGASGDVRWAAEFAFSKMTVSD